MAETTIARQLHELKERYHHELLNEEERLELLEAIKRLERKLAAAARKYRETTGPAAFGAPALDFEEARLEVDQQTVEEFWAMSAYIEYAIQSDE